MISAIYFTKIFCLYKSCNSLKYPFFISLSPADFIQLLYTLRYFLYVALVIVFLLFASSNISRYFCIPILLGLISVGDGASSFSFLYAPSFIIVFLVFREPFLSVASVCVCGCGSFPLELDDAPPS